MTSRGRRRFHEPTAPNKLLKPKPTVTGRQHGAMKKLLEVGKPGFRGYTSLNNASDYRTYM